MISREAWERDDPFPFPGILLFAFRYGRVYSCRLVMISRMNVNAFV